MAEQVPEAWIGEKVSVRPVEGSTPEGVLESVDERGIVVRTEVEGEEDFVAWYPLTSVVRIARARPEEPRRQARAYSF